MIMKIHHFTINNFRKFKRQSFIFHPNFTVLIGRNATGKTQILDAISIVLGVYITKIFRKDKTIRSIAQEEIRVEQHVYIDDNGNKQVREEIQYPVSLSAEIDYHGNHYQQVCAKENSQGRTTFGRTSAFSKKATEDSKQIIHGEYLDLPFLAYYGSGRLWSLKKHFSNNSRVESRTSGYIDSLDPNSDIKEIQGWIKKQELICLQRKKDITSYQLVKEAIVAVIPGCKSVKYDVEYDYIYLEFDDGSLCPFYNLSDGFRSMVAMIADMTRRIVLLNPHMGAEALKKTSGIVLIDEIDLYLHPEWQRRVVDDLKKIFPMIQFIATTHSPFIIQSLSSGEVIDLGECNDEVLEFNANTPHEAWPGPDKSYAGRSIEDIIEDIMGVPVPQRSQRYQQMYDVAKEYYTLLQESKNVTPEAKKDIKAKLDELVAPFSNEVAYYAFLEMERIAVMDKSNGGKNETN